MLSGEQSQSQEFIPFGFELYLRFIEWLLALISKSKILRYAELLLFMETKCSFQVSKPSCDLKKKIRMMHCSEIREKRIIALGLILLLFRWQNSH